MKKKRKIMKAGILCLCCICFSICTCTNEEKNKEKVIEWLLNYPHKKTFRDPEWAQPYEDYEQWQEAGLKIKDVEKILLELYHDEDSPVFDFGILMALGYVGTEKSIPFLTEVIKDKTLYWYDRRNAALSLGYMADRGFNVSDAIEPLSQIALDPEEYHNLRINSIISLGLIGDSNTIPVFQKALDDPNFSEFEKEKTIPRYLRPLQDNNIISDVNESI